MSSFGGMLQGWMKNHEGEKKDDGQPLGAVSPEPVTISKSEGIKVEVAPDATVTTTPSVKITPPIRTVTKETLGTVGSDGMRVFNPKNRKRSSPAKPMVKKEEPVAVKKEEPVVKKEEPVAVKKEEPVVVKKEEPAVKKEEPAVKKEEAEVKKEEPKSKAKVEKPKSEAKDKMKGVFSTIEGEPKMLQSGGGGVKQTGKQTQQGPAAQTPNFEYDRYFISWLMDNNISLMCSSYKAHRVFSIGAVRDPRDDQWKLSLWMTFFNRPMGLIANEKTCWVSSSGNMWRFENSGEFEDSRENIGKFDGNYVIRHGYFSSDIDNHDICTDSDGRVYYCSAAFSCVCTTSESKSFKVFWRPPWITKTVPEDRCHLNGICSRDGRPRYVSSVCQGNVKGAWRENRIGKGVIYDIVEDQVVCEGLTMPHSPRWYNGKLYLLDAGTGWFGYVDMVEKKLVQKVWLPGYLRGMSFVNNRYVAVGTSEDRHENVFQGLPLGDELVKNGVQAKCGIHVIDLKDFSIPHNMIFKDPDNELYDVAIVKGVRRPKLTDIGESSNMMNYTIDYGEYGD